MNKAEKNENVSKNVSVSRSIQNTNHFVTAKYETEMSKTIT